MECWFSTQVVGHNILANTVKRICQAAGIDGHFTNHSLRATAATRLFEAGVDEQLIMQRTGHSTCSGVRSYKRVGEKLRAVTSDVLNCATAQETKKIKLNEYPRETVSEGMAVAVTDPVSTHVGRKEEAAQPVLHLGGASNFTINFNFGKN